MESVQTPTHSPFKNTLYFLPNGASSPNSSNPQSNNLEVIGSNMFVLTSPVMAKFFTRPQFSPSGVERKHTLPQWEGCLHTENSIRYITALVDKPLKNQTQSTTQHSNNQICKSWAYTIYHPTLGLKQLIILNAYAIRGNSSIKCWLQYELNLSSRKHTSLFFL